ncbi:ATP-binding cassette domain-containing protein [Desulfovibrio desulfuricans]|uniref:ATP-binding cassette domain-containing protein n=1 Tax=Desulfovibrio desulfuricans TaxID=876 RepID=A0A4P7UMM3_DESDE|nr:ATP-binding cassette domain-containing protein [Desulfovibrio desulfuricans]
MLMPHGKRTASKHGVKGLTLDFIDELDNDIKRTRRLAVRMQGGQAQRPAIARVLSSESELIIFDEATSSIDMENKRYIHHATLSLRHNDHGHYGASVKSRGKLLFRHLSGQRSYAYGRKCRSCSA